MGTKKISWKNIWKSLWKIIVGAVFLIGAIITIVKNWDLVSSWLRALLNFIASSLGRDIILFIIIIGIIIRLILMSIKTKKLSSGEKREAKPVFKENVLKSKKEERPKLNIEQKYVLYIISKSSGGVRESQLFNSYQKEFEERTMIDFKSVIHRLEDEFIRRSGSYTAGEFIFSATRKGIEYMKGEMDEMRKTRK